jgi:Nucleoporin protein Ndc1-Nup
MFVMSAEEDIGLVQYDLGVWLNCLCLTLKTLEDYVRLYPEFRKHTPTSFLPRKIIFSEQDGLIKAIKLAISDVVRRFEKHLNHTGLNQETADMCQRVLELEGFL